jgi:hypothetical protein
MRTFFLVTFLAIGFLSFVTYLTFFLPTFGGYGYAGYGGYHSGPSIFYWRSGVQTYHDPSVRAGSRSGPGLRSGGIHGGK